MPIVPRPLFDPLPEPAAPDPADYTEMQMLAADLLPADDAALDQAGLDLAQVAAATNDGARAMDSLGLDIADGAAELLSIGEMLDPFPIELGWERAAAKDRALTHAGGSLADIWSEG